MPKFENSPVDKKNSKNPNPTGWLDKISDSSLAKGARILALGTSLLIGGEKIEAQENTLETKDKIENVQTFNRLEFQKFVAEHQELGPLLAGVFYLEQPDKQQSRAIMDLLESLTVKVRAKKFNSLNEEIGFINQELDSDFTNNTNTINLKDAFVKEGENQPRGTFDCDSRSVMIESVLSKTGMSDQEVGMYISEGHMLLYNKVEDNFFETTNNQIISGNKIDKEKITPINNPSKYVAYLLGNKAVDAFYNSNNPNQAKNFLETAKMLDSNNITNDLNYIKILEKTEKYGQQFQAEREYERLILKLVNKGQKKTEPLILKSQETPTQQIPPKQYRNFFDIPKNELTDLIKNSDDLKDKIFDWALITESNDDNFKAIAIYESLQKTAAPGLAGLIYDQPLVNLYLNNNDHKKSAETAEKVIEKTVACLKDGQESQGIEANLEQNLKVAQATCLAIKIMDSQIKIDHNLLETYSHSELLGPFLDGSLRWNVAYANVVETMKAWTGYKNFLNKIKELQTKK